MSQGYRPLLVTGRGLLARSIAAWGAVTHPFRDRRMVLCFHSISPTSDDEQERGYVSREQRVEFKKLYAWLEWLSERASFLSLGDLLADRGRGLRIALTFDDGYADVLRLGLPMLGRLEIPATWFVSPHFVTHPERLPWWDLLDFVCRNVRGSIEYSLRDESFRYDLAGAGERRRFACEQRERFLREEPGRRSERYREVVDALPPSASLPRNGFATAAEVREASRSEWITIGGHTMTHQNLAACSRAIAQREIAEGKRVLEEWCGGQLEHFAYPFGARPYWNEDAVHEVKAAGFDAAFVLDPVYLEVGTDRFTVPRLAVEGSWSTAEFRARVRGAGVYRVLRRGREAVLDTSRAGEHQ